MLNIDQQPYENNNELLGYYPNGQLEYRKNWSNGFLHGLHEYYQYNGDLFYCGYYNMNRKIGYWYYSDKPKMYCLWLI